MITIYFFYCYIECIRPLGCELLKILRIRVKKTIALFTLSFTLLTGTALISYVRVTELVEDVVIRDW